MQEMFEKEDDFELKDQQWLVGKFMIPIWAVGRSK